MGDFPTCDAGILQTKGAVTASSRGTIVTAGSANAEGSYVDIVDSCPFDADGFFLNVVPSDTGAAGCGFLFDIALNGAGSEVEIISDMFVYRALDTDGTCDGFNGYIPFPVPAGTVMRCRCRSSTASTTLRVTIQFHKGNFLHGGPSGKITVLGADTTDSGGLQINPQAAANTEVWVEFDSSLDYDARWAYITFGRQNDASGSLVNWLWRMARGASGNETRNIVIDYVHSRQGAGSDTMLPGCFGPYPVNLKAGDRLAVGLMADSTTNSVVDACVMLIA